MKTAVLATLVLAATGLAGFALGIKVERREVNRAIYSTEAMLWFNHLLQFRQIEDNLVRGCASEALELTRFAIDDEMRLLSGFHRDSGDRSLDKYFSDRDPNLLSQLEAFKTKYPFGFSLPQCRGK